MGYRPMQSQVPVPLRSEIERGQKGRSSSVVRPQGRSLPALSLALLLCPFHPKGQTTKRANALLRRMRTVDRVTNSLRTFGPNLLRTNTVQLKGSAV